MEIESNLENSDNGSYPKVNNTYTRTLTCSNPSKPKLDFLTNSIRNPPHKSHTAQLNKQYMRYSRIFESPRKYVIGVAYPSLSSRVLRK